MLAVTFALLVPFLVLAVSPPRLHYGLRFLALLGLGVAFLGLGFALPDFYVPAFPPLVEIFGELNLQILGPLGFILGFLLSLPVWLVRRLKAR